MNELAPLIYDLAIMLSVAGLVVILFQRLKQPVVLGYLVAGMIIGPYTPPHGLITDVSNIKILSELGVIFLMFSLGLEFSFHKLTKVGFSAVITGLIDVSMMVVFGYAAGRFMGWDTNTCIFLGATLAISSTTIIFKAVGELGLKTKRFAEVIFGVLIVEDLLAILLLVALTTMVTTNNIFSAHMFFAMIKLVLVVGAWFLAGYFLVPPLFRRLSGYISQETLTIVSVALCLFLVSVAAYFHYSTALGAFIMGSILAETVLVHRIEELIIPIRDIFGAIFFISVGMLINPHVIIEEWQAVIIITIVLMWGKVAVISLGTFLTGQSINTAVRSGFGMAQIGEFSFIIATLGLALHAIDDTLYPIIVAVSSITTFTTPYMIRLSGRIADIIDKQLPERLKHFLDSYTAWAYRTQTSSGRNPMTRSVTIRFVINAIIVAIIFTLINKYVFPELYAILGRKNHAKIVSEVLAIMASSPFIWGMLFSFKSATIPEYAKTTWNPIIFLVWLLTLAEVIFFSVVFFHTWITTAVFIILISIFFAVAYRHLEKSYHWFEGQLVGNIKKQPAKKSKYKELAPWDTHFVEVEVGAHSPFIGKALGECLIRQHFGVNIVAIQRGYHTILAPRGEERIQANDKLVVLGTDEQIELFKNKATKQLAAHELPDHFEKFSLKPILLDKDNPLVGKSIRSSMIRENFKGIIVGIERGNHRILNPDPETVIIEDDLLLIVGEDEHMQNVSLISK